MTTRTTLADACAGYDRAFERALVDEIAKAIMQASLVTDKNVVAIRTGETIGALATCLAATLTLCADSDVPTRLRENVDVIAKRIRRDAAKGRADGIGDLFGAGQQGHA